MLTEQLVNRGLISDASDIELAGEIIRNNNNQRWVYGDNHTLKNAGSGQCVDYAWHNQTALMYRCHGNGNQQWTGVKQASSQVLSVMPGRVLAALYR